MGKLFGTDGIRGKANQHPITAEMALKIGKAAACILKEREDTKASPQVVIGKDTRESGDMLEHALAAGLTAVGMDVLLTGVLPTPGIAMLTAKTRSAAGIVISASHNPFFDNGIKFFGPNGFKLSDDQETEIEKMLEAESGTVSPASTIGRIHPMADARERYLEFLKKAWPENMNLSGMKIVLDCANGATYKVAPKLFEALGAEVKPFFVAPDGRNINADCGSQHTEILAQKVVELKAHIGLAFDGDGDRLIVVDETGNTATGDQVLAACAAAYHQQGRLKNNLLVTTIMSNIGLKAAMKQMGITHLETGVGDRYVMEKMIENDAVIGGEDSGHMIFLDHHTTGDGILAAMRFLEVVRRSSIPVSEVLGVMAVFPQELVNVDVASKPNLDAVPEIHKVIQDVEVELGERGRVLVRYSGTQPMCRVMVEGPTREETRKYCHKIAAVINDMIGN